MKKFMTILFLILSLNAVSSEKIMTSDLLFLSSVYAITATENNEALKVSPIPENTFNLLINEYPKNKEKAELIYGGYACFKEKINQTQYFFNSLEVTRAFIKFKNLNILRQEINPFENGGTYSNFKATDNIFIYDFYITTPSEHVNTKHLPAPYPVSIIFIKTPMK